MAGEPSVSRKPIVSPKRRLLGSREKHLSQHQMGPNAYPCCPLPGAGARVRSHQPHPQPRWTLNPGLTCSIQCLGYKINPRACCPTPRGRENASSEFLSSGLIQPTVEEKSLLLWLTSTFPFWS